jgi:hypothetical protein
VNHDVWSDDVSMFEARTAGLDDHDRDRTLDLIARQLADARAIARRGLPHRDVDTGTRRLVGRPARRTPAPPPKIP